MSTPPTLVIFLGGLGATPAERIVDDARIAATRDTISGWQEIARYSQHAERGRAIDARVVVASDEPALGEYFTGPDVLFDVEQGDFQFGRRLAGVIRKYELRSVVYMGGGSLPLLGWALFGDVAEAISQHRPASNNYFSSDVIGFEVTDSALKLVESASRDNSLGRLLNAEEPWPRVVQTLFDIDAPGDVAVLTLAGLGGEKLRAYLASLEIDLLRYRAVLPLFLDQTKQLVVAGRVGSHAWSYLERETACRVRLFAEERGMEADGRAEAGTARSLMAYHLEAVGLDRFFETLSELGEAAIIDTRVLLAHKRIAASRENRFLSDLGRWEEIGEPWLRDFTRAASEAPIPVLLGGHSLMSGGLMALNEHAWSLRDAGEL